MDVVPVPLWSIEPIAMAEDRPSRIVYLFGAGATHAELQNIEPDLVEKGHGLLVSNVSSRVIERARRDKKYLKNVGTVSGTSGSLNIELLISLIENSKIHDWEYKTRRLAKAKLERGTSYKSHRSGTMTLLISAKITFPHPPRDDCHSLPQGS